MTEARPALRGACDCHMHLYDERWPLAPTATFKPPNASASAYRQVQRALGVRGVRYMMIPGAGGVLGWDSIERMAARIAPLGWNINLQLDGRELPERRALIDGLPGKVVIDHTGKFLVPVGVHDPAFEALLGVLDRPGRWVKLSAPYETSRVGPPFYDDVAVLARALLDAHPDRCLWASNWPHPNRARAPTDAEILALREAWLADAGLLERVMVANPAALYGFTGR